MGKPNPPYNPREDGDRDQEEFWAESPSIEELVKGAGSLMAAITDLDATAKMELLPDRIKSSPFSMALAAELLDEHPDMSSEELAEILNGL